jgi:HK97 family phage major capsid protein
VRLISAATGTTGNWTGENEATPMSAMDWDTASLQPLKVNALAAITSELARSSAPSADQAIARDVVAACALAIDSAFIDVENSGTANAKPASITSAGTSHTSSGNSLANIDSDLRDAVNVLDTADANIDSAVWVLRGRSAAFLSTLRGSGGNLAYPAMGLRGGSLLGLPALVSNAVPMDSNSPTETSISLVCASEVWVADDGVAQVEVSEHADLLMDGAPSDSAAQMVSAWAHGVRAVRATRYANWRLRRAAGCVSIVGVNF